mgnify:CR=1 FL=1
MFMNLPCVVSFHFIIHHGHSVLEYVGEHDLLVHLVIHPLFLCEVLLLLLSSLLSFSYCRLIN